MFWIYLHYFSNNYDVLNYYGSYSWKYSDVFMVTIFFLCYFLHDRKVKGQVSFNTAPEWIQDVSATSLLDLKTVYLLNVPPYWPKQHFERCT